MKKSEIFRKMVLDSILGMCVATFYVMCMRAWRSEIDIVCVDQLLSIF